MPSDHITVRISKRALLVVAAAVLVPGAFVAGLVIGGDNNTNVAADSTVVTLAATSTTTDDSLAATSTTAKSTSTTVAKKKKVAATTTTTTAPIAVTVSYSDNCPPANTANNRVNGTMTITWKSTSATAATLEIMHGADFDYSESNHPASGSYTTIRQCNNVRLADGSYPGRPLTVVYRVTVRDAAGKTAVAGGNDSM
jgi:hypothetical protein